ncbi:putative Leucine-rich repeat family protein [Tripterygium wilfordii]|uniref:Putative Leucine-rich repeat family protein n=1 Tax=Tripterygium wilfordii TaxID=458696 RepID=A0A7J7BU92_TRIWF|nr:uncharacterized protein LOC119993356 [Tripterygium wilfordii]KAF5725448.1 putative Leucine-rich repeat family protein [Tripterygium wilfordii]
MASSTDPSQGSKPDEIFTIKEIVDIISSSLTALRSSLPVNNGSNTISADNNNIASDSDSQLLEKVCNDLNYMKYAYENLKEYEKEVSKPILTLKRNLDSILESKEIDHKKINRILKDIGNLNSQIPPARKVTSSRVGAHQYLQSSDRSGTRRVPNLHFDEAFRSSPSYEELERLFETLTIEEKLCLLCFAVFPENALVKRRFLMYWWVGERLLDHPVEQRADEVLQVLMRKGFIEPVNKKRELIINSFRMQPLVRSAVIMLAKKNMFFDYDPNGNPTADSSTCDKACWVKLADGTSGNPLVNGESSRNIWGSGSIKNPEVLQTLFNVNEPYPDIPSELFSKMKELSVLCLGRWEKLDVKKTTEQHIEVESTEFLKGLINMRNLRLLSLQGVSRLEKFPSSSSKFPRLVSSNAKLSNLRILDLRACQSLEVLPDWLQFLTNLTHLDISECVLLNRMPKALVSLLKLEVLKGFVISDEKKENACSLADLAKLKKLRKLSIYVYKDFSIEQGFDALQNLEELKTLSIAWGAENTSKQSKPSTIQSVKNPANKEEKKHKVSGAVKKRPEMKDTEQPETGDGKKQKARSSEIHEHKKEQENVAAEQHPSDTEATNAETDVGKKQKGSGDVKKKVAILETKEGEGQVAKSPETRDDEKGRQNIAPTEQNARNSKSTDEKAEQDGGAAKPKTINSETRDVKMQQGSRPPPPARLGSMTKRPTLLKLETMRRVVGLAGPKESEEPTIVLPKTLEKLDLRCYPLKPKPSWLMPEHLNKLNKLCIRGGSLASIGEVQESEQDKWKVKILHLKYLEEMKMTWTQLQELFPHLEYLEKFKCPKITLCPCDGQGVWLKSEE